MINNCKILNFFEEQFEIYFRINVHFHYPFTPSFTIMLRLLTCFFFFGKNLSQEVMI